MYHITNDKRAFTSAGLILDALKICLKEKNYDLITITDVCRVSTVSRATFYRLFDNMDDVLAWQIELFANEFEKEISGRNMDEILILFFANWMLHPQLLDILIYIHREDILFECHRKRADQLSKYFLKVEHLSDYHLSVLTMILIGILTTWAKNGKKETPGELVKTLQRVLRDCAAQMGNV
jgi:AcrR family transcriptional regulator